MASERVPPLVSLLLGEVQWSDYRTCSGSSDGLVEALVGLITTEEPDHSERSWPGLEGAVFSQDDIEEVALPALHVLLAAVAGPQGATARAMTYDAVFHIVHAASLRDDDLGRSCIETARQAVWLFVRDALGSDAGHAEGADWVLGVVDPALAEAVRAVSVGRLDG